MKKLIIGLIVLSAFSCKQTDTKKSNMQKAKIIEMVLWKFKDGVSTEQGKKSVFKLNEFASKQPGFISRKTATSEDGKFLDVILWTDLESAKSASEKAMQNEMTATIFSTMDESEMVFQYFEIFNEIEK